jgi:hypothetical protein
MPQKFVLKKILVTQEDWKTGHVCCPSTCAVALAIKREIPKSWEAAVGTDDVEFYRRKGEETYNKKLPEVAIRLRRAFDHKEKIPVDLAFEMEVPA